MCASIGMVEVLSLECESCNPLSCPSSGNLAVSHLKYDSGNTLSCPSIRIIAVLHLSSVIATTSLVSPVLEWLHCHISRVE